jgi:hypothetical protein
MVLAKHGVEGSHGTAGKSAPSMLRKRGNSLDVPGRQGAIAHGQGTGHHAGVSHDRSAVANDGVDATERMLGIGVTELITEGSTPQLLQTLDGDGLELGAGDQAHVDHAPF